MSLRRAPIAPPTVALLCVDALTRVAAFQQPDPPLAWAGQAARILRHGRDHGWIIVHVLRGRVCGMRWRAADGLSPLPYERVFHREAPSAFSAFGVHHVVSAAREVIVVGRSVQAGISATLLDGVGLGLSIILAADAIQAPAPELADVADLAGRSGLVLQNAARLLAAAPPLRLVHGGQALRVEYQGGVVDEG